MGSWLPLSEVKYFIGLRNKKLNQNHLYSSLNQLKVSTSYSPLGQTRTKEPLLTAWAYGGSLLLTNDRHLALSKTGETTTTYYLPHFIRTLCSHRTVFISPYQKDALLSFSPFPCIWAIPSLRLCRSLLRSVLLCKRIIVTSVGLFGRHPSTHCALPHVQFDKKGWQERHIGRSYVCPVRREGGKLVLERG